MFLNKDLDGDLAFNDRTVNPDGSKVPVNSGTSDPVYRIDVRLSKQVRAADFSVERARSEIRHSA